MENYLSIDFESWAYPDLPKFLSLSSQERKKVDGGYVKDSGERILKILKKNDRKLTFFVLAQLYDWYPELIEKIAAAGHEIGYHTYTHEILRTKKDLVNSLEKSKKFLRKFKPQGFRAPAILIKKDYYQVLKDYGFSYSSSTYGSFEERKKISGVLEVPVTKSFGLPIGSGYFTALLGRQTGGLYRLLNKKGMPMVSFLHNWQIIKPRGASFPNLAYLLKKPYYLPYTWEIGETFKYLLKNFSFLPMRRLIKKN